MLVERSSSLSWIQSIQSVAGCTEAVTLLQRANFPDMRQGLLCLIRIIISIYIYIILISLYTVPGCLYISCILLESGHVSTSEQRWDVVFKSVAVATKLRKLLQRMAGPLVKLMLLSLWEQQEAKTWIDITKQINNRSCLNICVFKQEIAGVTKVFKQSACGQPKKMVYVSVYVLNSSVYLIPETYTTLHHRESTISIKLDQ